MVNLIMHLKIKLKKVKRSTLDSKIQFRNNPSVKNWFNLYDSIISPIMTYGSEIWISDFNIKLDNIHALPFEKA